jgi:hypothetical protein
MTVASAMIETRPWVAYRCPDCGHTSTQRDGLEVTCWRLADHRRKVSVAMRPEAKNTHRTR